VKRDGHRFFKVSCAHLKEPLKHVKRNQSAHHSQPLSLEQVAARFNGTPKGKGFVALCPAHDDHRPSLSIDPGEHQPVVVRCMSHNCDLEAILAAVGLKPKDICSGSNGNPSAYRQALAVMGHVHPHDKESREVPAFDWTAAREEATDERLQKIADWRGYRLETLQDLRERDLIGVFQRQVAFPLHDDIGWIIGAHIRLLNRDWIYTPKGTKTAPLVFTADREANFWVVAEGEWDAITFLELSGERGAGNGKLVRGLIPAGSTVLLLTQNDPLDAKGNSPALGWETDVLENLDPTCEAFRVGTPAEHADLNDWLSAGATSAQLWETCFK
jgi:hypothetical protein